MDDLRDDFDKELEGELAEDSEDTEVPLLGVDDDLEDDDEDVLLDQFGLHRVEEEEETDF